MGDIHHHAIVVTGWNPARVKQAHAQASKIFEWVSPISPEVVNGYSSFFIPPDGSKEGWGPSNKGESLRDGFINWLNKSLTYDDGESKVEWVEVGYGDYGYEVDRDDETEKKRTQAAKAQAEADDAQWSSR